MNFTEDQVRKALAAEIPNIKSQAQFNLFLASFDALRMTINAYYEGDPVMAAKGRQALNNALDMAKQMKGLEEKLDEIPDEEKSKAAKDFVTPAKELHEDELHKKLLEELGNSQSLGALNAWYKNNRGRIDQVISSSLRNSLFDAIRAKRNELS